MSSAEVMEVRTWEQCASKLRKIQSENSKSLTGVWFRGLSSADWHLTTTLERRHPQKRFTVEEYYGLTAAILPEVENFTGERWERPAWSSKRGFVQQFRRPATFGYMAHLRHHGFPSPLLDWTRSPYIAAYFAFADARPEKDKKVAIFAYSETPKNFKGTSSDRPQIVPHGGFGVRTHTRHFRQQSCYTMCVERSDGVWRFEPHQRVFDVGDGQQDRLYKIKIPCSERTKVLRLFDQFNLNDFSLFASGESLMETLAFRYIDQKI